MTEGKQPPQPGDLVRVIDQDIDGFERVRGDRGYHGRVGIFVSTDPTAASSATGPTWDLHTVLSEGEIILIYDFAYGIEVLERPEK